MDLVQTVPGLKVHAPSVPVPQALASRGPGLRVSGLMVPVPSGPEALVPKASAVTGPGPSVPSSVLTDRVLTSPGVRARMALALTGRARMGRAPIALVLTDPAVMV